VLTSGSSQEAPCASYQPKRHSCTAETAFHEDIAGNDALIVILNGYLLPMSDKTIVPGLKENLSKLNDQINTKRGTL